MLKATIKKEEKKSSDSEEEEVKQKPSKQKHYKIIDLGRIDKAPLAEEVQSVSLLDNEPTS